MDATPPILSIRILVEPQVATRPRFNRKSGRAYTAESYAKWQKIVGRVLVAWRTKHCREPIRHAVRVDATFVFKRPAARPTPEVGGELVPYPWPWDGTRVPKVSGGDLDNLRKAVLDVLVSSGVLADDGLVVEDSGRKLYAAAGEAPCIELRVWEVRP